MQGSALTTSHQPLATSSPLVAQPAAYRQIGLRLQYVHTADAIWELAERRPCVLSIHYGVLAQLIGAASSDTGRRHLERVAVAGVVRILERRRGLAIVEVISPERALLAWRARLAPPPVDEQLELFERVLHHGDTETPTEAGAGAELEPSSLPSPCLRVSKVEEPVFFEQQTRKFPATCGKVAGNVPAESPQPEQDSERENFLRMMQVRRQQDPACRDEETPPTLAAAFGTPLANVHVSYSARSKEHTHGTNRGDAEARRGRLPAREEPDAPPLAGSSPRLRASAVERTPLEERLAAVLPSDEQLIEARVEELRRRAMAPTIKDFVLRRVVRQAVRGPLEWDELLDACHQADQRERGGGFHKSRGAYLVASFRRIFARHGVAWFRTAQPVP